MFLYLVFVKLFECGFSRGKGGMEHLCSVPFVCFLTRCSIRAVSFRMKPSIPHATILDFLMDRLSKHNSNMPSCGNASLPCLTDTMRWWRAGACCSTGAKMEGRALLSRYGMSVFVFLVRWHGSTWRLTSTLTLCCSMWQMCMSYAMAGGIWFTTTARSWLTLFRIICLVEAGEWKHGILVEETRWRGFDVACSLTGNRWSDVFERDFLPPIDFLRSGSPVDITLLDVHSAALYKCVLGVKLNWWVKGYGALWAAADLSGACLMRAILSLAFLVQCSYPLLSGGV